MSAVDYSDLNTKGFVVVPNVLDQQDIERLLVNYKKARQAFDQKGNSNGNYNMLYGGPHKTGSKLAPIVDEINKATDINIDLIAGVGSLFDSSILQFGWHQDHEPFYMWQIAKSYVNFWIPLIKPSRSEAGLRLIPFDRLIEKTSRQYFEQYVLDHGAQNFKSKGLITSLENSNLDTTYQANFSLNEICVAPEVGPGDAIIMRGDLIHETQKTGSQRVAVSIKALNCYDRVVTRDKFFTGSLSKQNTINKNINDYAYHLMKFNDEGVDSFRLRELFPKAPIHYSEYKRLT